MKTIYNNSVAAAERNGLGYNLVAGANIAPPNLAHIFRRDRSAVPPVFSSKFTLTAIPSGSSPLCRFSPRP